MIRILCSHKPQQQVDGGCRGNQADYSKNSNSLIKERHQQTEGGGLEGGGAGQGDASQALTRVVSRVEQGLGCVWL